MKYLISMTAFDRSLWRERTRARKKRALRRLRSPESIKRVDRRFGIELLAISNMEQVINWCNERGIEVDFTRGPNGIFYPPRRIEINARCDPEQQLFTLLHECGHYLIDQHGQVEYATSREDERSLVNRVDQVSEEFEAWNRGAKLAARLGFRVNQQRYNQSRATSLNTYFRWASR